MEWASDEYCKCIAQALKTWTSAGGYSLWPSLEPWRSKEIIVSDGFCFGWFWHVLAVFVFVEPVMPHAWIWYCRIWGSSRWFGEVVIFCLAMMRRDSERSRRFCSVLFVSFAPEVQRRATSAGYAHLHRQTQSGRRFGANELHVLLASKGGFCWVDLSFKSCNKALP